MITMGTTPDKGGINPRNLQAMQALFTGIQNMMFRIALTIGPGSRAIEYFGSNQNVFAFSITLEGAAVITNPGDSRKTRHTVSSTALPRNSGGL